jgi:hypothetical protein
MRAVTAAIAEATTLPPASSSDAIADAENVSAAIWIGGTD